MREVKQQLLERLSFLRCKANEINSSVEWAECEEIYPLCSELFREIEGLEEFINSVKWT